MTTAQPPLATLLGLRAEPVAIGFFSEPPPGVDPWDSGPVPSGCTFWRWAQNGRTFYTVPDDHYNCALGSYTHRLELPQERAHELTRAVQFMTETGYVQPEEVPMIPQLPEAPAAVAYGPISSAPFTPDVVLLAAPPAAAMLLYEAALRAGGGGLLTNLLGRPGCAVLPLTIAGGTAAMSVGCRGSRMYSGLADDEVLIAIPGEQWSGVEAKLGEILAADDAMTQMYADRRAAVAP